MGGEVWDRAQRRHVCCGQTLQGVLWASRRLWSVRILGKKAEKVARF